MCYTYFYSLPLPSGNLGGSLGRHFLKCSTEPEEMSVERFLLARALGMGFFSKELWPKRNCYWLGGKNEHCFRERFFVVLVDVVVGKFGSIWIGN